MSHWTFGEVISGVAADGRELRSPVFNEDEVRAAAGLTMVLGAVAFTPAYFAEDYAPLRAATALFFVEFLIRVTIGLKYSPLGLVARWLTQRQPADRVSAKPKRFAWTIGLAMSCSMVVITNSGITSALPRDDLPDLPRADVDRGGARGLLGLRICTRGWCGAAGRRRMRPS